MGSDRYIEVLGEAEYLEPATAFVCDLELEVKAAHAEKALQEASELKSSVVKRLLSLGLNESEIVDCGNETWQPWHRRKKSAREIKHKLRLRSQELKKISKALAGLDELFESQRLSLSIDMKQPEFDASEEAKCEGRKMAIRNAQLAAQAIAGEANVKLGPALQIQEAGMVNRGSGVYGDEDYWGDSSRFGMAVGTAPLAAGGCALAAEESEPELASPTRSIWIKYRVRYGILES